MARCAALRLSGVPPRKVQLSDIDIVDLMPCSAGTDDLGICKSMAKPLSVGVWVSLDDNDFSHATHLVFDGIKVRARNDRGALP